MLKTVFFLSHQPVQCAPRTWKIEIYWMSFFIDGCFSLLFGVSATESDIVFAYLWSLEVRTGVDILHLITETRYVVIASKKKSNYFVKFVHKKYIRTPGMRRVITWFWRNLWANKATRNEKCGIIFPPSVNKQSPSWFWFVDQPLELPSFRRCFCLPSSSMVFEIL